MQSVLLIFLLCGVAYSAASRKCTKEEYDNCSAGPPKKSIFPVTEEQLDEFCGDHMGPFDCHIDLSERCPSADFARNLKYLKEQRRSLGVLCDKTSTIRQKFLKNVQCLKTIYEKDLPQCGGQLDLHKKYDCEQLLDYIPCAIKRLRGRCDRDAGEVFWATSNMAFLLREFCDGDAYSAASPKCTKEEFDKCIPELRKKMPFPETEEQLDEFCGDKMGPIDCQIDLSEKCPSADFAKDLKYMKELRRALAKICDETSVSRPKFLKNAQCLKKFLKEDIPLCGGQLDVHKKYNCEQLLDFTTCVMQRLRIKCDASAGQAFWETSNIEFLLGEFCEG